MKNECTQACNLMAAELNGDMTQAQRVDLKQHLALCSRCRAELARLRLSVALLEALPRPEPSAAFVIATLRTARLARQAQQISQRRWTRFGSVAALASGAAALVALYASGLFEWLAQWMLASAPSVIRLCDSLAGAAGSAYDSLAPFARGLLLVLTDTLAALLALLTHAGRSVSSSALPGYVLAIVTLSVLAALSQSRTAAGRVQVEKMP
jgi:anti-sigma factor RsiW